MVALFVVFFKNFLFRNISVNQTVWTRISSGVSWGYPITTLFIKAVSRQRRLLLAGKGSTTRRTECVTLEHCSICYMGITETKQNVNMYRLFLTFRIAQMFCIYETKSATMNIFRFFFIFFLHHL